MNNLSTNYMGLSLNSPVIVGASNLSENTDNLKKMEQAGAGAIVYKSLFEEQVQLEALEMESVTSEFSERHAEMISVFPNIHHAGPDEHLFELEKARKSVSIPLIASLNCLNNSTWLKYAQQLVNTGVDGLELNFYSVPNDYEESGQMIENLQIELVKEIKRKVSVPISIKISPYYTNPLHFIKQMDNAGVNAVVLFNNLFQPDIDIYKESEHLSWNLSRHGDFRLPLRFAGLLHGNIKASIIGNTGIQTSHDAIQLFLAGAHAVQVVSTLYLNKISVIENINKGISNWMTEQGYTSLPEFIGKLSAKNSSDPYAYKRAQYVNIMFQSNDIYKKFPQV